MNKHIKRIPLYAVAVIIAVFLLIWIAALIRCEVLTYKHYDEFAYAYQSNPMIGDVKYFKVLRCDGDVAEVYYVSAGTGDVLTFIKQNETWKEVRWETIWSKGGSASEVIWPYWTQFFVTGC